MADRFAVEVAETVMAQIRRELLQLIASGGSNNGNGGGHGANGKLNGLPRLMNASQCAEYLSCSESAVYHMVSRREIPFVKRGRCLRFDRVEIDKWIERGKV